MVSSRPCWLFHLARRCGCGGRRPPASALERRSLGKFAPYYELDRPGVRVSLLRPRAAADAGGHGHGSRSTTAGPTRRCGCPTRASRPRLRYQRQLGAGQSPVRRLRRGPEQRPGERQPEPLGAHPTRGTSAGRSRGAPGRRSIAQMHLIPDLAAGPRGPAEPGQPRRSTSTPSEFYTTPERIGDTRATPSDRPPGLRAELSPGRRSGAGTPSSSRPADPTPLGLIRVAVGPAPALEPGGLRPRPARLLRLRRLGRPGGRPPVPGRAIPVGLVVLVLVPDALLWPVWLACLVVLVLFTARALEPGDGGAGLGDRGLDGRVGCRSRSSGSTRSSRPGRSTWRSRGRAARRSRSIGSSRRWRRRGRAAAAVATAAGRCPPGCRRRRSRPTSPCG